MLKRAAALYTGGKDSHFAVLEALKQGVLVDTLIIVRSAREDSWMFHTVNIGWAPLHARLMGLKLLEVKVSGEVEKEVKELGRALKRLLSCSNYDFIVSGAVASKYQKERVDNLADELGIKHLAPLWGRNQSDLLEEEVRELGVIVTAVQAYGLGGEWLGKILQPDDVAVLGKALKEYGVSPVGEGGEYESFVIRSPLFRGGGIVINKASIRYYRHHFTGYYLIEEAHPTGGSAATS